MASDQDSDREDNDTSPVVTTDKTVCHTLLVTVSRAVCVCEDCNDKGTKHYYAIDQKY